MKYKTNTFGPSQHIPRKPNSFCWVEIFDNIPIYGHPPNRPVVSCSSGLVGMGGKMSSSHPIVISKHRNAVRRNTSSLRKGVAFLLDDWSGVLITMLCFIFPDRFFLPCVNIIQSSQSDYFSIDIVPFCCNSAPLFLGAQSARVNISSPGTDVSPASPTRQIWRLALSWCLKSIW